jgi:hypothetical protein
VNDYAQTAALLHKIAPLTSTIGYKASLEVGKLYRIVPDEEAAAHGYIRVVDESGEDYGYSANRFFPVELPEALEEVLLSATER